MKAIKEDPIAEILKKIAPGTPIREGLDNILKARTGALLLITDKQEVIDEIVDGGFNINEDYTSSKLYELYLQGRLKQEKLELDIEQLKELQNKLVNW